MSFTSVEPFILLKHLLIQYQLVFLAVVSDHEY